MTILSGARLVLPDRILSSGWLVIEAGCIAAIDDRAIPPDAQNEVVPLAGFTIVPGFIDVHVHGVEGTDVLDDANAVTTVAARLPKFGVTAFCPTSMACAPDTLLMFLDAVTRARTAPKAGSARVLPAHLESNFINPEWNGAQPAHCLRTYGGASREGVGAGAFSADAVLRVMESARDSVAIVTVAPELPGGLDLVRLLRGRGHIVSIGHSGASYDEAREAIGAGVTHATHLFNRMSPLTHRAPGVVGAVLESAAVTAEVICDGHHVHPAVVALALRTKTATRLMAITDGTAAAGLPRGSRAMLGGRPIVVAERSAQLEDGTVAGSIITIDQGFRMLVLEAGVPIEIAARMCSTTPADQLGLPMHGRLAAGAVADLVVLDAELRVVQTWIGGRPSPEHSSPALRLQRP
jgi:N-acetylglucosamine-6-phosphate deacetylase